MNEKRVSFAISIWLHLMKVWHDRFFLQWIFAVAININVNSNWVYVSVIHSVRCMNMCVRACVWVCVCVFPFLHVLPYIEIWILSVCVRLCTSFIPSLVLVCSRERCLAPALFTHSLSFTIGWCLLVFVRVSVCICPNVDEPRAKYWTMGKYWQTVLASMGKRIVSIPRHTTIVTDWTLFFFRFRAVRKMFVFSTFWLLFYVRFAFFMFEFFYRLICKFCGLYWRTKYRSMDRLNGSKYGNCILIQILWIYVLINSFIHSFLHEFAFIWFRWVKKRIQFPSVIIQRTLLWHANISVQRYTAAAGELVFINSNAACRLGCVKGRSMSHHRSKWQNLIH